MANEMKSAPQVYAAISAVMGMIRKDGIAKDRANQQQGYKFRSIDDIYNSLCGLLHEAKLTILPFVQDMLREERQTRNGGVVTYTVLTIDYMLVSAEDGSNHIVRTIGEAMDSGDKGSSKAMSAALKYAALQVFMIPTEGGNDADATTHELAPKARTENPPKIEEPGDGWSAWTLALIDEIGAATTDKAIDAIRDREKQYINALRSAASEQYTALGRAFGEARDALKAKQEAVA